MELEKLSKPEDTIVRQYIKNKYGVKVAQFSLWNLTPTEAASKLKAEYGVNITAIEVEAAARRK